MFDNLDDPRKQMWLAMAAGLLTPTRGRGMAGFGESLSQGLQAGLLGYNQASQNKRRNELEKAALERSGLELDALRRTAAKQKSLDAAMANMPDFSKPQLPSMAPTVENAQQLAAAPRPKPHDRYFKMAEYLSSKGLPDAADKYFERGMKLMPEVKEVRTQMGANGQPIDVAIFKDGTSTELPFGAATKLEKVDKGGSTGFVNPYTGAETASEIKKTLAPGEAQRIAMDMQRLGMEKTRLGMDVGRFNYDIGDGKGLPQREKDAIAAAVGKDQAKAKFAAQENLPKVEDEADYVKTLVDKMITHPGFKTVVGFKGPTGIPAAAGYPIAGTDAADFVTLRDQVVGKQFMQAYETLKGGGQITEIEGRKATDAMARMNTAQSEKAFIEAANEFKGVIDKGLERARVKAGGWSMERVK